MAFRHANVQWHAGEEAVHSLLHAPLQDNPSSPFLTPRGGYVLNASPLLATGTLDASGRPWTTVLGAEAGFARPIAQSVIGIQATVDTLFDPVIETLLGGNQDGQTVREEGEGRMISGLGIDLENRNRVKIFGRLVVSTLNRTEKGAGEAQMAVAIQESLMNCPKYLNKKHIVPRIPNPTLIAKGKKLPPEALQLLEKADLFFLSSSNHDKSMDTNHRGGPPGFVRVLDNSDQGSTLIYPEYSGNRLYQSLGNLMTNPKAGFVFPDFDTGDVLYITGTTEILAAENAARIIPHSNLAIKLHTDEIRFVKNGLSFVGVKGEFSPYNPPVRFLATEQDKHHEVDGDAAGMPVKVLSKTMLTPTIGRFRFQIENPKDGLQWQPGQYVALSFAKELDAGYSHMRDDDPTSLNDDFLRTFTVSSSPEDTQSFQEFEITIRKVGPVTSHLIRHNMKLEIEAEVKGFGGEFFLKQDSGKKVAFIAAGVGITPVLGQVSTLDMNRFSLLWTLKAVDIGLVKDTFERHAQLKRATRLFVTGSEEELVQIKDELDEFEKSGVLVDQRRLSAEDIQIDAERFYLCTGPAMRTQLLTWLEGQEVLYEDFNY